MLYGQDHGSYFHFLPVALRSLPLDLMRTATYPREPSIIGRAIEQFHRGEPDPTFVPGRARYQRWKKTPYHSAWGQNVIGMLDALEVANAKRNELAAGSIADLPIERPIQAADRLKANPLPQPTDNMSSHLVRGYVPLAREALPIDDIPEAEALGQWAQEASAAEDLDNVARSQALDEVANVQARYATMLAATTGPWFMR